MEFHNHLENSFPHGEEHRTKQGLECVGRQEKDNTWVLSPEIHISRSGILIPTRESKYAWQPIGGPNIELPAGKSQSLTLPLFSNIAVPLESSNTLNALLEVMKSTLKHNFVAGEPGYCMDEVLHIGLWSRCAISSSGHHGSPL